MTWLCVCEHALVYVPPESTHTFLKIKASPTNYTPQKQYIPRQLQLVVPAYSSLAAQIRSHREKARAEHDALKQRVLQVGCVVCAYVGMYILQQRVQHVGGL